MYACCGILVQVIGASFGVLAAHSAGEGNQPLRQLANLLVLSVAAAAATTAACSWLLGDILQNVRMSALLLLLRVWTCFVRKDYKKDYILPMYTPHASKQFCLTFSTPFFPLFAIFGCPRAEAPAS